MIDVRRMGIAPKLETFLPYAKPYTYKYLLKKCRLHESGRQWYYVTTALIELARWQDRFDVVVGERSEMSSATKMQKKSWRRPRDAYLFPVSGISVYITI